MILSYFCHFRSFCIMSMTRKTITITETMNDWVKARIASGEYGNDSEYFRDLIRKDQGNLETLRALLIEGETGGVSDRSVKEIWDEAERKHLNKNA